MTSLVVALLIGIAMGAGIMLWALARRADSESGRRRLAVMRAEQRVRAAQAAAFTHMADMAEAAVHEATGSQVPSRWPSDETAGDDVEVAAHPHRDTSP